VSDPAISVQNVIVSYDGRRVLDGINLNVERGETMVLLGGSGSGKSTLLRQIIGLEHPQSGQVLVNGIDLGTTNQKELKKIHRSMGVAFQNSALFDSCLSKTTSPCRCVNSLALMNRPSV
jgi:phospholipid/cholesterol/gamma-HCH transport system ATP-binding protein